MKTVEIKIVIQVDVSIESIKKDLSDMKRQVLNGVLKRNLERQEGIKKAIITYAENGN